MCNVVCLPYINNLRKYALFQLYKLFITCVVSTSSIPEVAEDEPDLMEHQKLFTEASTDAAMATTVAAQQAWKSRMRSQRVSEVIKLDFDLSHPVYCKLKLCILQWVLRCMDKCDLLVRLNAIPSSSSNSPTPHILTEDNMPSGEELICEMWYTSRDNVNLLLEICRQGMIASQSENKFNGEDTRNVIMLYKSWVQVWSIVVSVMVYVCIIFITLSTL